MLAENKIDRLNFEGVYPDAKGERRKCYNLTQDLTYALVTGYRSDLRLKIIRRWMEPEQGATASSPTPAVPTSFRDALLLAASQQEEIERQKALIDEAIPKVAALDRIAISGGSFGLQEAAKILQLKPGQFIEWLDTHKWTYKRGKQRLAYQNKLDDLYLKHKVNSYTDANGELQTTNTARVTPKGLAKLAQIIPGAHIDPAFAYIMKENGRPFARKPEPAS